MSYYPSLDELLSYQEHTGSESLLQINRSIRSILSNVIWFCITVLFVYAVNLYIREPISLLGVGSISPRWLAFIPSIILLEIFRKHKNELYVLEPLRIVQVSGRLSLNYNVPVANYSDIRGISVEQDLIGRIFDYGTLYIGTAAESSTELALTGVRRPRELCALLYELRDRAQELENPTGPDLNQSKAHSAASNE